MRRPYMIAQRYKMDIYGKDFLVLEIDTKELETYQLKSLYYQQIVGIREFRHSISGDKSLLFYPNQNRTSLSDLIKKGVTNKELHRLLEQVLMIIKLSESYLLYPENISLDMDTIKVQHDQELRVELLYIPRKRGTILYNEGLNTFLQVIATAFHQCNDIEKSYYLSRLAEDMKKECFQICIKEILSNLIQQKKL